MSRNLICPNCKKPMQHMVYSFVPKYMKKSVRIFLPIINGYILPDTNLEIDYSDYTTYSCPHCKYVFGLFSDEISEALLNCVDNSTNMVYPSIVSAVSYWNAYTHFVMYALKNIFSENDDCGEDLDLFLKVLFDRYIEYCFNNDILIYDKNIEKCSDRYESMKIWQNSEAGKEHLISFYEYAECYHSLIELKKNLNRLN